MIRISIEAPLLLECATVDEAIAALRSLSALPTRAADSRPAAVNTPAHRVNASAGSVSARPAPPAIETARVRQGQMKPTGKTKRCKRCRAAFPVLDRTDCAAVLCKACRPKPARRGPRTSIPRPAPKAPPAAGLPARRCEAKGCLVVFAPERPDIVHCHVHRLGPGQNRGAAGKPVLVKPVPAAAQPSSSEPVGFQMVTCRGRDCGASVPVFESIDGLCLQCAPIGARKRAS